MVSTGLLANGMWSNVLAHIVMPARTIQMLLSKSDDALILRSSHSLLRVFLRGVTGPAFFIGVLCSQTSMLRCSRHYVAEQFAAIWVLNTIDLGQHSE